MNPINTTLCFTLKAVILKMRRNVSGDWLQEIFALSLSTMNCLHSFEGTSLR